MQGSDAFALYPKCLPCLDNWSLGKLVKPLEGESHLEVVGDSGVSLEVYSLALFPFPSVSCFHGAGRAISCSYFHSYSHTMAAGHDELYLQTMGQNKPSSLELLVRYLSVTTTRK